jgi:hypothetical protein
MPELVQQLRALDLSTLQPRLKVTVIHDEAGLLLLKDYNMARLFGVQYT